jgi:hypothetical protein
LIRAMSLAVTRPSTGSRVFEELLGMAAGPDSNLLSRQARVL